MEKIRNLELGAILTMTTGYKLVDDFNKVWELVWFVCDDNMIGPLGLGLTKDEIKKHLLSIHPELRGVKYQNVKDINEFIREQEEKFGRFLPVTIMGEKLSEESASHSK